MLKKIVITVLSVFLALSTILIVLFLCRRDYHLLIIDRDNHIGVDQSDLYQVIGSALLEDQDEYLLSMGAFEILGESIQGENRIYYILSAYIYFDGPTDQLQEKLASDDYCIVNVTYREDKTVTVTEIRKAKNKNDLMPFVSTEFPPELSQKINKRIHEDADPLLSHLLNDRANYFRQQHYKMAS